MLQPWFIIQLTEQTSSEKLGSSADLAWQWIFSDRHKLKHNEQ